MEIVQAHPTRRLDEKRLRRLIRRLAQAERCALRALSVILTDHATVLHLNRRFLEHDYLTDVLSFPFTDEPGIIEGEVYVDLDTAAERHAELGVAFEEEALRYALHGVLHLAGHDDATPEQQTAMRTLEDRYLADEPPP